MGFSSAAEWNPTDVDGCVGWWRAISITGLNDDDKVSTWLDESGNGRNFSQATEANQPTYKTSIQNSLPVVRFADDTDTMSAALVASDDFTIAIVRSHTKKGFEVWNGPQAPDVDAWGSGCYNERAVLACENNNYYYAEDSTETADMEVWLVTGTNSVGPPGLYTLFVNGAERTLTLSDAINATHGNVTGGSLFLNATAIWPANFDIAELAIYNRVLTIAAQQTIASYLNAVWAVY
jgi:hypothetical protein